MACSGSEFRANAGNGEGHGAAPETDPNPSGARQAAISREIQRHGADPTALIEVLHRLQLREGFLAADALHQVARELRLPLSRVFGVASFYNLFRLTPPPRHRLALCRGTACFVNGAEALEVVLRARFAVGNDDLWRASASKPEASQAGFAAPIACPAAMAARSRHGRPERAGVSHSRAAVCGDPPGDAAGNAPIPPGRSDGPGGWRLERSGCLGVCGAHPVLRLEDGPVLRLPLQPSASLVARLAALGLPLAPQLPALAP